MVTQLAQKILSIHAPTRGATPCHHLYIVFFLSFNPRSYKRSDDIFNSFLLMFHVFQSTLLQEERLSLSKLCFIYSPLSIHAPTRGATTIYYIFISQLSFQSTLLQEERRNIGVTTSQQMLLSIHAPTRGATLSKIAGVILTLLSIHAPTRGATVVKEVLTLSWNFQSTLLQEERRILQKLEHRILKLSIHAPTRGAT